MSEQNYKYLTPPQIFRQGDECWSHGKWIGIGKDFLHGKEQSFKQPARRPVDEKGEDYPEYLIQGDGVKKDDQSGEETFWERVGELTPAGRAVPGADITGEVLGYFAFIDDKGLWRNSHNKAIVPAPIWWLTQWPDFPEEDLPAKYGFGESNEETKAIFEGEHPESAPLSKRTRRMMLRELLKEQDDLKAKIVAAINR